MTVITMSRNELTRLRVLIDVADGRLSVADATGLIGVGRRQIYRLLQTFRADGPDGVISRKRGRPRQPRSGCGVPRDRAGPRARALRRFWPHLGGREVVRAAWPGSWDRNIAAVDASGCSRFDSCRHRGHSSVDFGDDRRVNPRVGTRRHQTSINRRRCS